MANPHKLIRMLKSRKASTRYEACEDLRVMAEIPDEARAALQTATKDPDRSVADAAIRALHVHEAPQEPPKGAGHQAAGVMPKTTRVRSRTTTTRGSCNVIGIDLGTTNSVAAMVVEGKPTVITSAEGGRLFPSVVAINPKTGERMVGEVAKRQGILNPENTIFSAKRLMGRKLGDPEVQTMLRQVPYKVTAAPNGDPRVWMGSKEYSPPEISAMILQKLRSDAETLLGLQITRAVITVPAYFDGNQRQATKIAGRIAGLDVLRIINEPTAASLAYGLDMASDETIAVYHLGGGTFDISVLEIGNGCLVTRATSGDTFLGGNDWDWHLTNWLADQFNEAEHIDLRHDPQALERLGEACEKAKVELSTLMETEIDLPFIAADTSGPKHLRMKLTRAKLEQLTEDLIQRTIAPCEKALADAKLKPSAIDTVVLVGGMTRMPAIQQRVAQFFGKEPCRGVDPDEVVGVGAAIQAGVLGGAVKDVVLVDATPLTLSVETDGGRVTPLIARNTTIPAHQSKVFSTTSDSQSRVNIHVLEGERPMANDNRSLARVIVDAIPPAPKGVPQIEVSFDVDTDSALRVSALDKGTGREQSVRVIPTCGLSHEEVERMVGEAEQYRKQVRERAEGAEVRHEADYRVHRVQRVLSELGDNLPADLRSEAEAKVGELRSSLEGNDTDTTRNRVYELGRVLARIEAATDKANGPGSSPFPGVGHPWASEEHPNEVKPQTD